MYGRFDHDHMIIITIHTTHHHTAHIDIWMHGWTMGPCVLVQRHRNDLQAASAEDDIDGRHARSSVSRKNVTGNYDGEGTSKDAGQLLLQARVEEEDIQNAELMKKAAVTDAAEAKAKAEAEVRSLPQVSHCHGCKSTASAAVIARDLLAQAEHDTDAAAGAQPASAAAERPIPSAHELAGEFIAQTPLLAKKMDADELLRHLTNFNAFVQDFGQPTRT